MARTGSATIVGRLCVWAHTGSGFGQPLSAPTPQQFEDMCVDDTGLALREESTRDGTKSLVRTVTRLDMGDLPDGLFDPESLGDPFPQQDTETREVDPSLVNFPVWRVPESSGFRLEGVQAQLSTGVADDRLGIVLLYSRGPDAVELIESLRGGLQFPDEGLTTTVSGVGDGRLVVSLSGSELRFPSLAVEGLPRQIELRSLLPPRELQDIATKLEKR